MPYQKYVIDCETTGLDPVKNDIIEICIWRIGDPESKTWCMKPLSPENIQDSALNVNGHLREDILWKTASGKETYREPSEVLKEIEAWIMADGSAPEDRVWIGQNPMFDYDFFMELYRKVDSVDNFPFGYWTTYSDKKNNTFIIDTIELVKLIDIVLNKRRKRYGLSNLVSDFQITKAQAHRADGDVKMTKELFEKIIEPMAFVFNQNFLNFYKKE